MAGVVALRDTVTTRHPVLVVTAFGVVFIVVRALLVSMMPATGFRLIMSDLLTYIGPIIASSILALMATRVTPRGTRGHRFWLHIAVSSALLLVAEVHFTFSLALTGTAPGIDAWRSILLAAAGLSYVFAVLAMTPVGLLKTPREYKEASLVFAAILVVWVTVHVFFVSPRLLSMGRESHSLVSVVISGYPALGVGIITVALRAIFGGVGPIWSRWERMAMAACVAFAAAMCTFPYVYLTDRVFESDGLDFYTIALSLAFVTICLAAYQRIRLEGEQYESERLPVIAGGAPVIVGRSVLLLGGLILTTFLLLFTLSDADSRLLSIIATVLVLLLVVRNVADAVERAAHHRSARSDPVTGAFNARMLRVQLDRLIKDATSEGMSFALLVVDVEEVRRLEVMTPAQEQDDLYRGVARHLETNTMPAGQVFYLGGDEYAVIIPRCTVDSAKEYAYRIVGQSVIPSLNADPRLTFSIGIALFPDHATEGERLQASAEVARSTARASVTDSVMVYSPEMELRQHPIGTDSSAARGRRAAVQALAAAVDGRIECTREHSRNVARLAASLGQVLDLSSERISVLEFAGLAHDIGKIGITDLTRPLDDDSDELRAEIVEHSVLGERILGSAGFPEVARIVRSHHERWNGSGYPDGLVGPAILIESRVLSICDSYEAMISDRPYRSALSRERAIEEISARSGTHFDPDITDVFIRMIHGMHSGE